MKKGKLVMPAGKTDYELMRFRFANIKKSTGYLAGVIGMERKEFEAVV